MQSRLEAQTAAAAAATEAAKAAPPPGAAGDSRSPAMSWGAGSMPQAHQSAPPAMWGAAPLGWGLPPAVAMYGHAAGLPTGYGLPQAVRLHPSVALAGAGGDASVPEARVVGVLTGIP